VLPDYGFKLVPETVSLCFLPIINSFSRADTFLIQFYPQIPSISRKVPPMPGVEALKPIDIHVACVNDLKKYNGR
jgi:hypothetical protein